jgi:hypothetical protein
VERTEGRLSLAVLIAGAALVFAAGTAWWVAAAPATEAQLAEPAPPLVVPEAQLAEPAPPLVAPEQIAPEPTQNGLDSFLPPDANTVQRDAFTLSQGETYPLTVAAEKDGAYVVQYVCLGEGELVVRIWGTTEGEMLHHTDCGGNITAYHFVAANPTVVVEVTRPDREPAGVGVQVIDVEE